MGTIKIIIIGAGPVGLYLAYKLALNKQDVCVYEEHKKIGEPVQCTGIVSSEFSKIIKLEKEFIVNKLRKARIYSKNKKVDIPIEDIVIDRAKFDRWLLKKAIKAGVKVFTEHRYLGFAGRKAVFADKKNRFLHAKTDILIGADGPLSEVAKSNKLFGKREFYTGLQARVKGKFDKEAFEVYLGSVCPGFFAWLVPESSKTARIGLAAKKDALNLFLRFLEAKGVKKKNIINKQAGLIPIYNKSISSGSKNILLIGDAAGHVKATTGGGIVPGLKAAEIAAECILNGSNYKKELKKLNKELKMHLKIRKILDNFSDHDYNDLISMLGRKKVNAIFKNYNRDSSYRLVVNLLSAEPRLLKYLSKIV